jgi:hypothetical protein
MNPPEATAATFGMRSLTSTDEVLGKDSFPRHGLWQEAILVWRNVQVRRQRARGRALRGGEAQ